MTRRERTKRIGIRRPLRNSSTGWTRTAFPIVGEFRKGRIHFAGVGGVRHDGDSNELDIAIGRVQPDGTLAGTMVTAAVNFTWRAVRK